MRSSFAFGLILIVCLGCSDAPDAASSPADNSGNTNATEDAQPKSSGKQVDLPSDPFFTEFAYPGAVPSETLTMGGATSVWYATTDPLSKVADFYAAKFPDGNNVVEAKRAYFTQPAGDGPGYGATVTQFDENTVQIILKLEKP